MSQVNTVTGPISAEELGTTMCHVHVLIDLMCLHIRPKEASKIALVDKPLAMNILGVVRRDVTLVKDNLVLGDIDEATEELRAYRLMGGRSLVSVDVPGIGRDPVGMRKVSEATGLNIICSTGWYVEASHPSEVKTKSIDGLCDIMVRELKEGIGTTGIKAGAIKIAVSGLTPEQPFMEQEEKVLRAAGRAQAATGAAMTIHPNRMGKHHHTYMDVIQQEGADLRRLYFSHVEAYSPDLEYEKTILERGASISYDQFGHEEYFGSRAPGYGFPPDRWRVDGILALVEAGYVGQIVLSNEVALKCAYRKYGGYGYGHLLENIVPELRYKGITSEQLHTMLVENPKRLLPF